MNLKKEYQNCWVCQRPLNKVRVDGELNISCELKHFGLDDHYLWTKKNQGFLRWDLINKNLLFFRASSTVNLYWKEPIENNFNSLVNDLMKLIIFV